MAENVYDYCALEQDDLSDQIVSFELAMLASEEHFFNPYELAAYHHYGDLHIPSFLDAGQQCMSGCDVRLGGCEFCAPYSELADIVGHDELVDWIVEVCAQMGICSGCGGYH